MPSPPERDVHLLLSQNAAQLVGQALDYAVGEWPQLSEDEEEIIQAVIADLREQIEPKPKKARKKAKK